MKDAHSQPVGKNQDLLYDPEVPTLTHAERSRTLLATCSRGTLSSFTQGESSYPYGSFVTFSVTGDCPTFFVSELAEHTRNIREDDRASLMVVEDVAKDPLANSRATLLGRMVEVKEASSREQAQASYLKAHPSASRYIDYSDFNFWQLQVESIRYIGGYGRMSWVSADEWRTSESDPMRPFSDGIIKHMNDDHGDAMVEYCRVLTRATDATAATMTAVDRYGFEMSALTGEGPRPIRLAFSEPISSADGARKEMVALVKRCRAASPSKPGAVSDA
ncbi:MAG: DUF2470 domain-containing protein [Myxococcota bacterium]|nr:DUF2470 domain-containing protein [Myxococcota bacterium]